MTHYDEDQWVDYARGLSEDRTRHEMESHLESGCSKCGAMAALYRRVAGVAVRSAEQEPPGYAVRSAKAYFALQQTERAPGLASLVNLRLAFDSFAEASPAGRRGLGSTSRQLVYYGNDYALTLRMDYGFGQQATDDVSLGGELLHRSAGPVSNVPALLMSGHTVVGYSLSGELGDFHMTCGQDHPLTLRMLVDKEELIEIDLD